MASISSDESDLESHKSDFKSFDGDEETAVIVNRNQRNAEEVEEPMPEIKSNLKLFIVQGLDRSLKKSFVAMPAVSTDTSTSEETITRELGCRARCFEILPELSAITYELPEMKGATSLVYVGSHLYFVGGDFESGLPCNQVFKLDTNNLARGLEECHKMLQERAYPAVFSVNGIIYVFGGLPPFEGNSSPWAEFLDTSKPKEEQQWEAFKDPSIRNVCSRDGCTRLFAFPYDAQTFLIGCGIFPNQDAVLYNVVNGTSSRYESFPELRLWRFACPVITDKTIYWIDDCFLVAYELHTRRRYYADMTDIVFGEEFFSATSAPRLVHLEDHLFGFFSLLRLGPDKIGVVGCTKVLVGKGCPGMNGWPGSLEIRVVGYQSYRCDPIYMLSGVLSM